MARHINIPVFIPHLGCPNQCVFCNQRSISGVREFDITKVKTVIEETLMTVEDSDSCEIAFFGGSFTGIGIPLMTELLEIAYGYVKIGKVQSIRLSTRPDYISEEILDMLKKYGVKTIELGLQSFDDGVLSLTKRGHTSLDELKACKMIISYGFDLVGQMMIGLPGSTPESEIKTAEFISKVGAVGARIYPTVVFKQTELCELTVRGDYSPLGLEEAVERSKNALCVFIKNGVKVIRIGLCSSESLSGKETYYAGPNHEAIGEFVIGEIYYELIRDYLSLNKPESNTLKIVIPKGHTSKLIGQKARNKDRLKKEFGISSFSIIESEYLEEYRIKIIEEGKEYVLKVT